MQQPRSYSAGRDIRTVGLIGLVHGLSHFFQLVLPPLFLFLIAEFEVSYTELGVVMTVFFAASGVVQAGAGFLVDHFGARRVLIIGLAVYCVAIVLFGLVTEFWMFIPVAALAGVGNSVFHPADITILNAQVTPTRLGRAFGVHTLGGNLGWALASVFMFGAAGIAGWRGALFAAAALGFAVLVVLLIARDWLQGAPAKPEPAAVARLARGVAAQGVVARGIVARGVAAMAPLIAAPIVLCFFYFLLLAAALIAVQNYLPPTLVALHQTPFELAASALSGFLVGAAAGVLVGGFIADHSSRHDTVIAIGLAGSALIFVLLGFFAPAGFLLVGLTAAAGFLSGVTTPSRDLLVRSATPPGATGRVFGFVYSGLDVGSALAPISVGLLLDHGAPAWALWLVALILFAGIFTAVTIRGGVKPAPQAAE